MSIVKMKSKLLRQKYENFNQFKEDFRILASNAKLVCVKGDVTWQNITLLEDEFHLFVFLQEERAKKHQIVIDEDPMPAKVAKTVHTPTPARPAPTAPAVPAPIAALTAPRTPATPPAPRAAPIIPHVIVRPAPNTATPPARPAPSAPTPSAAAPPTAPTPPAAARVVVLTPPAPAPTVPKPTTVSATNPPTAAPPAAPTQPTPNATPASTPTAPTPAQPTPNATPASTPTPAPTPAAPIPIGAAESVKVTVCKLCGIESKTNSEYIRHLRTHNIKFINEFIDLCVALECLLPLPEPKFTDVKRSVMEQYQEMKKLHKELITLLGFNTT